MDNQFALMPLHGHQPGDQFPVQAVPPPGEGGLSLAKNPKNKPRSRKACDTCASFHRLCDNAWPTCRLCIMKNTPCTYNKPSRKRGPKTANMDKIAERVIALVTRNPALQKSIIDEMLYGREPETGRPNIEIIQDPAEKAKMLATFDQCPVAHFLNDYNAGMYSRQQPQLPAGPLARGIEALNVPPLYQQPQGFGGNNNAATGGLPAGPQTRTNRTRRRIAVPHVLQFGPAASYSLPSPAYDANPPGFQHTAPVPPRQNHGGEFQQQQLPSPTMKHEPEEFKWELDISEDEKEAE